MKRERNTSRLGVHKYQQSKTTPRPIRPFSTFLETVLSNADMTDLGSTHFIQFCIQYASIALLYYDYTLTFSMEVEYVWKARFRLSTILYILCRYALVANVIYLLNIGQKIGINCDGGYMISGALSVLGRAAIVVVWTMRTYAVWNRNRLVLAVLSIIGAACIILSIIHVPAIRCEKNSSVPIVPLLLAILMCIFEFFSTALATFRSLQALGANGFYIRCRRNAFVFLVLEQGILYFSTTSLFTIASVVLNITVPGGFMQRLLNGLTLPLSGLLAARFLLHLRKWEDKQSRHHSCVESSTNLQLTTVIETVLSYVDIDDFGEDPLRRAERCMNAAPGVVVEEWKKYGGWCDNEGLDS